MLISSQSRYSKTGGLWDPSDDCCRPRCTLDRPCGQGEVNLVVLVVMLVAPIVCGGDGQMLSEPRRTYILNIMMSKLHMQIMRIYEKLMVQYTTTHQILHRVPAYKASIRAVKQLAMPLVESMGVCSALQHVLIGHRRHHHHHHHHLAAKDSVQEHFLLLPLQLLQLSLLARHHPSHYHHHQ